MRLATSLPERECGFLHLVVQLVELCISPHLRAHYLKWERSLFFPNQTLPAAFGLGRVGMIFATTEAAPLVNQVAPRSIIPVRELISGCELCLNEDSFAHHWWRPY